MARVGKVTSGIAVEEEVVMGVGLQSGSYEGVNVREIPLATRATGGCGGVVLMLHITEFCWRAMSHVHFRNVETMKVHSLLLEGGYSHRGLSLSGGARGVVVLDTKDFSVACFHGQEVEVVGSGV